ncbi:DUF2339 domain-containing protein [Parasphingorhabdus halotolerans]|uniref:DUF2339 domain-containing protein n=1 Tax=Parasphingorhabdus halotolerans TaxID=2725558 RepID=A0A6H2DL41_9SPHN|nr:DUF2339 domain-containing protein [Parasphingorhabdus halotolerans]QJB68918.1 DUF2339 domain-containing protein [Parasphingorhabdus halotolerans]
MIDLLIVSGVVLLGILMSEMRKNIASLKARIEELEAGSQSTSPKVATVAATLPAAEPTPAARAAKASPPPPRVKEQVPSPATPEPSNEPAQQVEPEAVRNPGPKPSNAKRFEDLIGGKLPIWIGGIALVFAGFFLVRFSIEAGLFGPVERCIAAALFGGLLIGLAEFGYKIPRFGKIFTDDARIGHSIAGAGIAVLYATLYMASELYGLLGLTSALVGVIAVTIVAFLLSQKHGPPTAIMGLLGGFAAPYVAGLGPESVAPLLIYLGIFTGGLFGLAIHRGWAWLALLATGGSVLWTTALFFMGVAGEMTFIGIFVVLLAIGGVLTLSRMDKAYGLPRAAMQAIPLTAGLLQLAMLAPLIEFTPISWLFFGVLSLFTIALAWRDQSLTPAVAGALGLSFIMVAIAFYDTAYEASTAQSINLITAITFAVLFGAAGHIFALREKSGWMWALIGLAAPVGMLLITAALADLDWSNTQWGGICLAVGMTTAFMAWRTHKGASHFIMAIASALTASLLVVALWLWTPSDYAAIVTVLVAAGLASWTRFTDSKAIAVETGLASTLAGIFMLISGSAIVEAMVESLSGETDLFSILPRVGPMAIKLLVPATAIVALAWYFRRPLSNRLAGAIAAIGLIGVTGFAYLLFKQPLAIGPIQTFVQYGFAERMLLTHLLALVGWLLLSRTSTGDLARPLRTIGITLASLALFRFVYFDLFLLSPTSVKQALGPAPVANLATLHYTSAALWLWLFARTKAVIEALPKISRPLEIGSLLLAIAAVMVTVRQLIHGTDIATPPFTSTETYLYSAGLLILAIAWLARGIQTTNALLRIAGLLLLTLVTFKVFLVDAAQLDGILRILSFLGLGIALIGIGWIYGKVMRDEKAVEETDATAG